LLHSQDCREQAKWSKYILVVPSFRLSFKIELVNRCLVIHFYRWLYISTRMLVYVLIIFGRKQLRHDNISSLEI
jgi:hypothetical protein